RYVARLVDGRRVRRLVDVVHVTRGEAGIEVAMRPRELAQRAPPRHVAEARRRIIDEGAGKTRAARDAREGAHVAGRIPGEQPDLVFREVGAVQVPAELAPGQFGEQVAQAQVQARRLEAAVVADDVGHLGD